MLFILSKYLYIGHRHDDYLVTEPLLHEYIRHGYISALQNWDDIATSIRGSQAEPWRNDSSSTVGAAARPMPGVWGNQWGLPGVFPISTLMSQTSDVVWIEGPPGDSAATAWDALTYKVGDASGDFGKVRVLCPACVCCLLKADFHPEAGLDD